MPIESSPAPEVLSAESEKKPELSEIYRQEVFTDTAGRRIEASYPVTVFGEPRFPRFRGFRTVYQNREPVGELRFAIPAADIIAAFAGFDAAGLAAERDYAQRQRQLVVANRMPPNAPCMCGSGKKSKACCGR